MEIMTYPNAHILLGTAAFPWTWDNVPLNMHHTLWQWCAARETFKGDIASKVDKVRGAEVTTHVGFGRREWGDRRFIPNAQSGYHRG